MTVEEKFHKLAIPELVNENYKLVFGSDDEPEAKDTTKGKEEMEDNKGCESCKHTDKTEEDYPCIACNRNYSIQDKMHWKYPDRWEPAEEEKPTKSENTISSIEEKNEEIQQYCMEHFDGSSAECHGCLIEKLCDMVGGDFLHNPNECNAAYNILIGKEARIADAVNHPAHYQGKHECIDEMIALFGRHAVMDFCRCNVYKYRYRAAAKGGQEDLDKANWYMDKLIELQGKGNA